MGAKSIRKIDASEKTIKNAAIYCRVSSGKERQLNSLTAQISALTRMVIIYQGPDLRIFMSILLPAKTPRDAKNISVCYETAAVGKLMSSMLKV